jgi:hypothetical protein
VGKNRGGVMELIDVVRKLIGPIEPLGCSSRDKNRLDNLNKYISLVYHLIDDMKDVSKNKTSYEYSVKEIGETADKFLDDLKEDL